MLSGKTPINHRYSYMKIAITGKGGVGKTLIAAGLAITYRNNGKKVIAIDADPDANLAATLGLPEPEKIVPIVEMKRLITERTGEVNTFFKLNPKVDDIPDTYAKEFDGIKLLVMGTVKRGGAGCVCPENAFLKALLSHILLSRDEIVVIDMAAGVEHLGRGTAQAVDRLFIVVEPNMRSIETAKRIKPLAKDLRINNISIIGNKIVDSEDVDFIKGSLLDFDLAGFIDFDEAIAENRGTLPENCHFLKQVAEIKNNYTKPAMHDLYN